MSSGLVANRPRRRTDLWPWCAACLPAANKRITTHDMEKTIFFHWCRLVFTRVQRCTSCCICNTMKQPRQLYHLGLPTVTIIGFFLGLLAYNTLDNRILDITFLKVCLFRCFVACGLPTLLSFHTRLCTRNNVHKRSEFKYF